MFFFFFLFANVEFHQNQQTADLSDIILLSSLCFSLEPGFVPDLRLFEDKGTLLSSITSLSMISLDTQAPPPPTTHTYTHNFCSLKLPIPQTHTATQPLPHPHPGPSTTVSAGLSSLVSIHILDTRDTAPGHRGKPWLCPIYNCYCFFSSVTFKACVFKPNHDLSFCGHTKGMCV